MKLGGQMTVEQFEEFEQTWCPEMLKFYGLQLSRTLLRPEGYWVTMQMNDTDGAKWEMSDCNSHGLVTFHSHGMDDMGIMHVKYNLDDNKFVEIY